MKRSLKQKIGYVVLFVCVLVAVGLYIPMALRFQSAGDLAVSFLLNMGFFAAGLASGYVTVCQAIRKVFFQWPFARFLQQQGFLQDSSAARPGLRLPVRIVGTACLLLLLTVAIAALVLVLTGYIEPVKYRSGLVNSYLIGIFLVSVGKGKLYRDNMDNATHFLAKYCAVVDVSALRARPEEIRKYLAGEVGVDWVMKGESHDEEG